MHNEPEPKIDAAHESSPRLLDAEPLHLPSLPPPTRGPIVAGSRTDPWVVRAKETDDAVDRIVAAGQQTCELRVSAPDADDENPNDELERLVELHARAVTRLVDADIDVVLSLEPRTDPNYVEFISRLAARSGLFVETWLVPASPITDQVFALIAAHSPGTDRDVKFD